MEIRLKLLSDATFGRGDGVSGLVDEEIEYDPGTGLPLVRGRTLKGLVVEACADIFYSLEQSGDVPSTIVASAEYLFGRPGSYLTDAACLHIGAAQPPQLLRQAVVADVKARRLLSETVLQSLTDIRRQTSVDEQTERPEDGSLRSMRVLIREVELTAPLAFRDTAYGAHLPLLAARLCAVHRGGTGRNRGRGRLQLRLHDDTGKDVTTSYLQLFGQHIGVLDANPDL